jgi:flagellar protein FliL
MSAAKAEGSAPSGGVSTKKLIMILVIAMGLMAVGIGGAVMVVMKRSAAAHADDGEEEHVAEVKPKKKKAKEVSEHPVFLPLDPFVVNLTDREQDRYAQIGITLEIDDPKVGEKMKTFMPAIRNGILLVLAHKGSKELLDPKGKQLLAEEIMREAVRPLGFDDDDSGPVRAVHFSSFIIQ